MKFRRQIRDEKCTLLLSLMIAFTSTVVPAYAKGTEEWVIGTVHPSTGNYLYYITENAIRVENTGNGGIVIAKAPTWRVSCFRVSDKLEYTTELNNFDASAIFSIIPKHSLRRT